MEIKYCGKCHSRVSSVDVDAGKGVDFEGKVYCDDCAHELDLYNQAGAAPQTAAGKPGSGVRKFGTGVRRKPSSAVRKPPSSATHRPPSGAGRTTRVHAGEGRPSAPAKSNIMPIIIALAIIVILLLAIVAVLLAKKKKTPAVPPRPDTPIVTDTPSDTVPDKPVPAPDIAPDTPPDKPVVAPVPAGLPVIGTAKFPAQGEWRSLLGPDWSSQWETKRGTWQFRDGMLQATLGDEAAILSSSAEHENYEIGITLAVVNRSIVELRFREEGRRFGKIVLRPAEPNQWHTITWKVEGGKVTAAAVNGVDVKGARSREVIYSDINMPMTGKISIVVNPLGFAQGSLGIAEISMRPLAAPAAAADPAPSAPPVAAGMLNPFDGSGKWKFGTNNRPTQEGNEIVFKGSYIDVWYDIKAGGIILEGEMLVGAGGEDVDNIAISFPARRLNHENDCPRPVFFQDGTLQVKGLPGRIRSQDGLWKAGEWFRFKFTVQDGKTSVWIDDKSIVTDAPCNMPFIGGIHFRLNTDNADFVGKLRNLKLAIPGAPVPATPVAAVPGNIIPLGDFEKGTGDRFAGWDYVDKEGVCLFRDTTEKHTGASSMKLTNFGQASGKLRVHKKDIPVRLNTEYKIVFWMKTRDLAKVGARGPIITDKGGDYLIESVVKYKPTQDWTRYELSFNSGPNDRVACFIGAWVLTSGTIWFDDLSIVPVGGAPLPGPEIGWIRLMEGSDLKAAGWRYEAAAKFGEYFQLKDGVLTKPAGTEKETRIAINFDFPEGEISFDYDFSAGGYWDLDITPEPWEDSYTTVGINRRADGKHTCLVKIKGAETSVFIDGKAVQGSGWQEVKLKRPIKKEVRFRITVPSTTALKISNLRYRTSATIAAPPPAAPPPAAPPPPPFESVEKTATLQQGQHGYTGCIDCSVFSARKDTGSGNSQKIQVEFSRTDSFSEDTYLRFDLNQAGIPAGSKITSAEITLWCMRENSYDNRCEILKVESPWDESLTYTRAQSIKTSLFKMITLQGFQSRTVKNYSPEKLVTFTITDLVQGWLNAPGTNYGFMLRAFPPGSNFDLEFRSSEYSQPGLRPRLIIKYVSGGGGPVTGPGPAPIPTVPTVPASAAANSLRIDFEKKLPRGMVGKLDRKTKLGSKSLGAALTSKKADYEVKAEVPLSEPVTITDATTITFKYYLLVGSAMEIGIAGTDAAGKDMDASFFKMASPGKKWQTMTIKATALKVKGKAVAAGGRIKSLRVQAGFKGDESKTRLYIDDIVIVP